MNKKQLIAQLSGSLNLSKADAERTFDTITNTILHEVSLSYDFDINQRAIDRDREVRIF